MSFGELQEHSGGAGGLRNADGTALAFALKATRHVAVGHKSPSELRSATCVAATTSGTLAERIWM